MLLSLDGNLAAQILETFAKKGSVIQAPIITTTNNVEGDIQIAGEHSNAGWSNLDTSKLTVTPRVNSDNSVTLKLHSSVSYNITSKVDQETQMNTTQEVDTLRTLKSGDTLMIGIPSSQFNGKSDRYLLLFVTATILPHHSFGAVTVH